MYKIFNKGALLPLPPSLGMALEGKRLIAAFLLIRLESMQIPLSNVIPEKKLETHLECCFRVYIDCDDLNGHIPSLKQTTQQKTPFALVWSSFIIIFIIIIVIILNIYI